MTSSPYPTPRPKVAGTRTKSNQRGYDGHCKRCDEHVDVAVQERKLPGAGVPQANDVGVAMVDLHVVVGGLLGCES